MPSKPSGWDRLNAHVGVTREGRAIICNDFTDMIWHAQRLSQISIGVEIEGNYYGVEGKKYTWWEPGGGPHNLNDKMLIALDAVYDYIENWFDKFSSWMYVHAHRQSGKNRASDPGQEIWETVGKTWLLRSGASDGGERFCVGKGRPIPSAWDIRYNNGF
jgi:hypothetical protein